ncbi:MAG: response regulator [Aquabacterium sp.]|nr:response regulator [Aquabacterium sp.]
MTAQTAHVHLLVVDDDDVDRERVLRLLGRTTMRFEAKEASSSAHALQLLREHEFDCVMLDNQLGDASGADLLPAIHRAARRDCPVIMITGAGNESLAVQALQEGAADYLTKFNLSADVLVRAIQRALDHHRMRVELDELHQRLEQRVAQQAAAIRQSERDLRAILDHTPTVIGFWDASLHNRFGNRAWRRWTGVDPERLPGHHLGEVIGAAGLARIAARVELVLQGESQSFEQEDLAPDGHTVRHGQYSLHPDLGDDGTVRGFFSSITDVTVIKQAQARAEALAVFNEALFEHSPVGLGVYDDSGCCVMANPALARLFGATVPDLLGLPLDALTGDDVLHLTATRRATLADGMPRRLDVDLRSVFGTQVHAACAWAQVERKGQPQSLLAAQDMSAQRLAHEALVAARDAAEQATRAKGQFLANMSHEIRTPMNAIVGLTRLALDDPLPPEARDFIDKAHQSACALMDILDDVLDYSKAEAGQLRIEHLPLDIEQVVQRAVDLFSARLEQKNLAFDVDLAPDLPRCVLGDPMRLSQVLNNLLGNAVKFTERGHVLLTVQPLRTGAPASDMVRFSVRDSGIGIDPAHQAALFEAFTQADASITRRFGGTGLGLTICRRLVTMMHGSIGFESVPGVGSEFWFTARLDRAPVDLPEAEDAAMAGLRMLVAVPDGPMSARLCERLRGWQIDVRAALDEADLLAQATRWPADGRRIDAVLIDQAWFGGPAMHTLQRLRGAAGPGAAPTVLGIVSVVRPAATDDRQGVRGPDAMLPRPVLPTTLRKALAELRNPPAAGGRLGDALAQGARPLQGLRLLLVEDNEINRLVAQVLLERLGADLRMAGNGAEALEVLQAVERSTFDAVLMDVHMPEMDGLEATRRLRAIPALADLPVIGMTAAAMSEDRQSCFDAGMVDYTSKPIVVERLLEILLHWTGRRPRAPEAARPVQLPGFDLTTLLQLLHGNEPMLARMLGAFAQQEATTGAEVAALIANHDHDEACRRLHKLRGGAGSLGAIDVARTAAALEKALRERRPTQTALTAFSAALQSALSAIATRGVPGDA